MHPDHLHLARLKFTFYLIDEEAVKPSLWLQLTSHFVSALCSAQFPNPSKPRMHLYRKEKRGGGKKPKKVGQESGESSG